MTMIFEKYHPSQPISNFVEDFWCRSDFNQPQAKEMLLPNGSISIVFNLRERGINIYRGINQSHLTRLSSAVVRGPYSRPFTINRTSQDVSLGVQFKAGGSVPFLGLPASELSNSHIALEALWGSAANELLDDLLKEQSIARRFHILEKGLLSQLTPNQFCRPVVSYALKLLENSIGMPPIAGIAQGTGISHKRLIDLFKSDVGMTPKKFCRVKRFNATLESISRTGKPDWVNIALECGYFDQAHFNHDFTEFSGLNPTCYLASRRNLHSHVRIVTWV